MADTDFNALVTRAMAVPGRTNMRPVVEKELLHYDILFALDRENLLDKLTFQGGTCLRLCYGAPRFSEDLDFVAGTRFQSDDLVAIKECLERYLGSRYGLAVRVKEPSERTGPHSEGAGIQVERWKVSIQTAPERPDLPHQKIRLEVVNVPAHTRELLPLRHNYDFLPDGYDQTLVRAETLSEVMADKLIAYPVASHPRYRDIWDLQWLAQQNARLEADLLIAKIADYGLKDYPQQLDRAIQRVAEQVHSKEFEDTMRRFLPEDTLDRTLRRDGFLDYLGGAVKGLLESAQDALRAEGDAAPSYRM